MADDYIGTVDANGNPTGPNRNPDAPDYVPWSSSSSSGSSTSDAVGTAVGTAATQAAAAGLAYAIGAPGSAETDAAQQALRQYTNINLPATTYMGVGGKVPGVNAPPDPGPAPAQPTDPSEAAQSQYATDKAAWDAKKQAYDAYQNAPQLQQYLPSDVIAQIVSQQGPTGQGTAEAAGAASQGRASQIAALQGMGALANGGLNAADKANLLAIQKANAIKEQASRGAIMQNAEQRGVGGSGLALSSLLGANQATTEGNANMGATVAGDAATRQYNALNSLGNLGSNEETNVYGEASKTASAQDAINQFNAQALNQAGATYTANQNLAAQGNVTQNNALAEQNALATPQANFNNQMELANAKAAALGKLGTAQGTGNSFWTGLAGNAIGAVGKAVGNAVSGGGGGSDQTVAPDPTSSNYSSNWQS